MHLEQMKLCRLALRCQFVEGEIRVRALEMLRTAASGDLPGALGLAEAAVRHIRSERAKAEEALALSQSWAAGRLPGTPSAYTNRKAVAEALGISIDVLRNWERNALVEVPRGGNGYRVYGAEQVSRLIIIRTLRQANYSMTAILRMMNHVDAGRAGDLRAVLDTPEPEDDIVSATDRWISALRETEAEAREVVDQLKKMIQK
jgi:DNA-binding transcriptional MerR regulator